MKCTYTINDRSGMILRLCDVYHGERFYLNSGYACNMYLRSELDILRGHDIFASYVTHHPKLSVIIV